MELISTFSQPMKAGIQAEHQCWKRYIPNLKNKTRWPIIRILLEHGADPTLKNLGGTSPLSLTSGYRLQRIRYTKVHANGNLHQLLLTYVNDPSKLDDTLK